MSKHVCIYCKKEKEESEFNREHVVPRMMGTYENGFVLCNCEVCEECNTFFSRELENRISLNSLESFLRIQHGRPMSDGKRLRKDRVSFIGMQGIFKGLELTPVVDSTIEEKMHFDISPVIGILSSKGNDEYVYYSVDDLPQATTKVLEFLKGKENGIITAGMKPGEATPYLLRKGYLNSDFKMSQCQITDLYAEDSFMTRINVSIDSLVRRTCAKTVFNYLCYSMGKEYVLDKKFDDIRNYIRYGNMSSDLWFRYSQKPVSTVVLPNDTSHVVGYMFYPEAGNWILCGCLTWFGELTYIFKLGITGIKISQENHLPSTKMAYFDNVNRKICEDEGVYIFLGSQQ